MRSGAPFGPDWVISGGAGRSATRQVKLNKRTLTARSAQLSFVQKLTISVRRIGSQKTRRHAETEKSEAKVA
jgi:hypothetical protein